MGKAQFKALEVAVVKLSDVLAGDFGQPLELALDPDHGAAPPPSGSRAARLHQLLGFVKQYLLAECARPSYGEQGRCRELFQRVAQLDAAICRHVAADPAVRELEPPAWALARDARSLARRAHVTIARPRWPSRNVRQDARSVFVSGALPSELPERLIGERGLQLLFEPKHGERAAQRYNQLQSADLAIFRLKDARSERGAGSSAARAQLANTCYELGIALTLGLSILVIVDDESRVPLEIPCEVVRLERGEKSDHALVESLEDVAFGIHWGGDATSARLGLEQTLEFTRRNFTDNLASEARVAWAIAAECVTRPHEFVDRLKHFLSYCGSGVELLFPAWPATYPKQDERRVHHAVPAVHWSLLTSEVLRDACLEQRAGYSRSASAGRATLPACYGSVASASHLIADVTELDPIVALELGIAHTLGKPCRLVHSEKAEPGDGSGPPLFAAIAGDRAHAYSAGDGYRALERQLAELLAGSDG